MVIAGFFVQKMRIIAQKTTHTPFATIDFMKLTILLLSILFSATAVAQTIPDTLTTVDRPENVLIPKTHIRMPVPEGFKLNNNYYWLENTETKSTKIIPIEEHKSFSREAEKMNDTYIRSKGADVLEYKVFTFNGYKAQFIVYDFGKGTASTCLLYGDETFYVELLGVYPSWDEKITQAIRTAILSSVRETAR